MPSRKSKSISKSLYKKEILPRKSDGAGGFEGKLINTLLTDPKLIKKGFDHVLQDEKGKIVKIQRNPDWVYFIIPKDDDYWIARSESFIYRRKRGLKKGEDIKEKEWLIKVPITRLMYRERWFVPYYTEYKGKPYIIIVSRSRKTMDYQSELIQDES